MAGEAGRPTSGGPGGAGDLRSGSGGYALLAAAHGGLATAAFLAPTAIVNFFFPGAKFLRSTAGPRRCLETVRFYPAACT